MLKQSVYQCCTLKRKTLCVYSLALFTVFTSLLLLNQYRLRVSVFDSPWPLTPKLNLNRSTTVNNKTVSSGVVRCGSVFPDMLHGRWVPKPDISKAKERELDEYLEHLRADYRIPRSLQRADGSCGNLPYVSAPLYKHMWFRALCNPKGPTPCCHNFLCTWRSREECRCPDCLDPRTPVHAELSDWLPVNPACRPREFSVTEACDLLKGTTLLLVGDSFVRHVFVTLVMLLTDDFQDGALQENARPDVRSYCQGMYQINGLRCRAVLEESRSLCDGTVQARYREIFPVHKGTFLLPFLQSHNSTDQKLLLFLGVGIHDDFRADLVWPFFLKPVVESVTNISIPSANVTSRVNNLTQHHVNSDLQHTNPLLFHQNAPPHSAVNKDKSAPNPKSGPTQDKPFRRKWPRMIWLNTHAPGLLKSQTKFPAQSLEGVRFYNKEIARLLEPYGVPVLDSFNMTSTLHSVDGTHYGYGANHLKVQFLLNWVKERQDRHEW